MASFAGLSFNCFFSFALLHSLLNFQGPKNIFIYLLGDIAFLPIEVLLVTIIIRELLSYREKQSLLSKMNMVTGAFFSEVGTELLKSLSLFDESFKQIRQNFLISPT